MLTLLIWTPVMYNKFQNIATKYALRFKIPTTVETIIFDQQRFAGFPQQQYDSS